MSDLIPIEEIEARRIRIREAIVESHWRCFGCGILFTDYARAKEHFGPNNEEDAGPPACVSTRHPLVIGLRQKNAALEQQLAEANQSLALYATTEKDLLEQVAENNRLEKERNSLREKLDGCRSALKATNDVLDAEIATLREQLRLEQEHHAAVKDAFFEFQTIGTQQREKLEEQLRAAEANIDLFWQHIYNAWDIEPREYFEKKYPLDTDAASGPLQMAAHYLWKRNPRIAELQAALAEANRQRDEAATEMLLRIRASLQEWPNAGCDIVIGESVERIVAQSHGTFADGLEAFTADELFYMWHAVIRHRPNCGVLEDVPADFQSKLGKKLEAIRALPPQSHHHQHFKYEIGESVYVNGNVGFIATRQHHSDCEPSYGIFYGSPFSAWQSQISQPPAAKEGE